MILRTLTAAVFAATLSVPAVANDRAGDFDFYVLSLSWSPTHCATDDDPDPEQCDIGLKSFTVHGLWPQYESGYPEYCPTSHPRGLSRSTLRAIDHIMPADGLARYQWRKHGMCSGLDEEEYFSLMVEAAETVKVPPPLRALPRPARVSPQAIETLFVAANPGMSRSGIAVQCRGGQLTEVRICLTKDLEFRACDEVDDNGCRSRQIDIPIAR